MRERAAGVAFRQRSGTVGVGDHGGEHPALVPCGEGVQLSARRSRVVELTGRERDLDMRREQRRPLEGLGDFGARPADGDEGQIDPPLGQSQLRQARLRLPPHPAGIAVSRLGRVEPA